MKRYFVVAIAAFGLLGATQAREVAFCDSGFNVELQPGDKAACVKRVTETYRDYLGNRHCPTILGVGSQYSGNENPSDGGDLCDTVGGAAAVPAILCHIDPAYLGKGDVKTDMNRGARDRCYVNKTRTNTSYGDIKTRNE
jgi:hypothetical protein